MTENIKKYLGIAGIAALLLITLAAWRYVDAYANSIEPSAYRSFTATGEAKVTAIPDVAEFSFSVITQGGKDVATLQKENTDKTNKAIAFVKSKSVDAKDIKTSQYYIEPRYETCNFNSDGRSCPPPQITGYNINQTVTVKVRDFAKIGDLLSGVVSQGANSVSQINFTIDDPMGVQNEAKAKAIQNAEERAKVIAKAGNFRIGRLLSIDENTIYPPATYGYGRGGAGAADLKLESTPAPAIEPGSQEVNMSVTLKYEIR